MFSFSVLPHRLGTSDSLKKQWQTGYEVQITACIDRLEDILSAIGMQ
jgi:hypothetical protein